MGGSVRVLLFAQAREVVGRARVEVPVPDSRSSVSEILDSVTRTYPPLLEVLRHSRIVLNGAYVKSKSAQVNPGDELAIHPPYSGG